jgi:16S rRNA (cytosine1402-N4)-methyltransferase
VGELHASHGSDTPAVGAGVSRARGRNVSRGEHTPVLLERCLELLSPALIGAAERGRRPVHVDATLGLGGHAEAVLAAHPDVLLVGLDRDPTALTRSAQRLAPYADRTHLVHAVYDELPTVLSRLELDTVDAVLFDLGVSSMQLDEVGRGFSYAQDAPLDMRMDPTTGITAEEVVNTYPPADLVRVLRAYGEEKFATRVVSAIVRERDQARITSSARLAELVRESIPAATRRTGGHPAKRTFQALRIEVNRELASLEAALPAALDALAIGGRIVVMAYQSLEDRLVKRALAQRAHSTAPVDLPVELPGTGPSLRLLTRGAEMPDEAEVRANPRAASVRLRAGERIDPDQGSSPSPAVRLPQTRGRRERDVAKDRGGSATTRPRPSNGAGTRTRKTQGGPAVAGDTDINDKGEVR